MKKLFIITAILITYQSVVAQQLMRTYYDYKKTQVHEEFYSNSFGVKNGSYKEFSTYGGILVSGFYTNDIKTGKWITKDEKGNLISEKIYDKKGECKSALVILYKDGYKWKLDNFKNGVKHGNSKEWYFLNNGNVYLNEDGKQQLKEDYYYKNGNLDSLYFLYWPNGYLHEKGLRKDGNWIGEYKYFYESNGKLECAPIYIDGKMNGLDKCYYESGELFGETPFTDDKQNGVSKKYHKNGKLKEEVLYIDGQISGTIKEYEENGQLISH